MVHTQKIADLGAVWRSLVLRRYRWCDWPNCQRSATDAVAVDPAPDLRFDLGNGIGYCATHAARYLEGDRP
jgi:hypothetical protein